MSIWGDQLFEAVQIVPRPLDEVFAFFSNAMNLERITPPWLKFHVLKKSTPEIQEGTLIDYRLRIRGIPVRWQSRITQWQPNRMFADEQTIGPYRKWHHTHTFEAIPEGTRMTDRVLYQVALGSLGEMTMGWMVRSDIAKIFAYRKSCINELFKK